MAERKVLLDSILVRRVDGGQSAKSTAAFRSFGLRQVAPSCAGAQYPSACRNLKSFGNGLLRLNAFWTSHKSVNFLSKRARNIRSERTVVNKSFGREKAEGRGLKAEG